MRQKPVAPSHGGAWAEAGGSGRARHGSARAPLVTGSESSGSEPREAIEDSKMLEAAISILLFDLFWWLHR